MTTLKRVDKGDLEDGMRYLYVNSLFLFGVEVGISSSIGPSNFTLIDAVSNTGPFDVEFAIGQFYGPIELEGKTKNAKS